MNKDLFSSELYKELLKRTNKIYFVYHPSRNKIIYINFAIETLLEEKEEAIVSDPSLLLKAVYEEDIAYVKNVLNTLPAEKDVRSIEFRIVTPDKTIKWLRADAYYFSADIGEVIITIAADISSEKEYMANLNKFNEKKNSILEILSHDLAGPLGNIELYCSLLENELKDKKDEKIMNLLERISRSSKNSVQLIREFINQEFLESSETVIIKQRVDIVKKITHMMDEFKASEQIINRTFNFNKSVASILVVIDETKFMQALQNLVSNAIKFTREDGIITLDLKDEQESILITVTDNGVGIPAHLQPFLFDKFTKARRPGLKGQPTTGLGMSIVKRIVEWHNGKIWFESEESKGSTFYIQMPKE